MFTGIIQAVGTVRSLAPHDSGVRMLIDAAGLDLSDARVGDSIAVSGACLTVVELDDRGFAADLSAETLDRTVLGELHPGARVNLEPALRFSDRLGGHLVSGHVDGVGSIVRREPSGGFQRLQVQAPDALARYIAPKGSVTVDGVSLTVNAVQGPRFELMLIPQTLEHTTLGDGDAGRRVNLEVDIVARYLERLLQGSGDGPTGNNGLTRVHGPI